MMDTGSIYEGHGASIELRSESIVIRRKGLASFVNHGLKGEKIIPLKNIAAIQFKIPGALISGYIQFTLGGGRESVGGIFAATKDENTVMFTKAQGARMTELRDKIEAARLQVAASAGAPVSTADTLSKLADLLEKGLLTREEFNAEKAKLLV